MGAAARPRDETIRGMRRALLPLALAVLATVACSQAIEPPPIELSFRESFLAAGKIVQVKSTSNEPLEQIAVKLTAPNGDERRFVQESLEGYGSFEVGWKKLGGWEIPPGTEVEVRVEGYLRAAKGSIPAEG